VPTIQIAMLGYVDQCRANRTNATGPSPTICLTSANEYYVAMWNCRYRTVIFRGRVRVAVEDPMVVEAVRVRV